MIPALAPLNYDTEMEAVEREREAAQAHFEEGSQYVQTMKAKTQQMTEKHNAAMGAMQGQLDNLAHELERL